MSLVCSCTACTMSSGLNSTRAASSRGLGPSLGSAGPGATAGLLEEGSVPKEKEGNEKRPPLLGAGCFLPSMTSLSGLGSSNTPARFLACFFSLICSDAWRGSKRAGSGEGPASRVSGSGKTTRACRPHGPHTQHYPARGAQQHTWCAAPLFAPCFWRQPRCSRADKHPHATAPARISAPSAAQPAPQQPRPWTAGGPQQRRGWKTAAGRPRRRQRQPGAQRTQQKPQAWRRTPRHGRRARGARCCS